MCVDANIWYTTMRGSIIYLMLKTQLMPPLTNDGVSGVNHYPLLHPSSCVMCRVGCYSVLNGDAGIINKANAASISIILYLDQHRHLVETDEYNYTSYFTCNKYTHTMTCFTALNSCLSASAAFRILVGNGRRSRHQ